MPTVLQCMLLLPSKQRGLCRISRSKWRSDPAATAPIPPPPPPSLFSTHSCKIQATCRFAMSFSAENRGTAPLRAPLSPLRQPVQRRPGEGQGTSHRKRKVSWFFGRQPCELGSDSDECPTMEEKSPGERFLPKGREYPSIECSCFLVRWNKQTNG